ncbi:hypothetical protein KBC04_04095 [Candidatus Babeliales bacterium]|nr:hypothetical protein [Candidatus Babeliales bacterium]MBP9843322.1 hypothetical protein [Candidatus Babeliales bacterium]
MTFQKNYIYLLIFSITCNLQAVKNLKVFSSNKELTNFYKKKPAFLTQPSLDELANKAIDAYRKSIPYKEMIFFKIRNEQAEQAYVDTLLNSIIELQKKPQLKNNNQKLVQQAKFLANTAHCLAFTKPILAHDAAYKAEKKYQQVEVSKVIEQAMQTINRKPQARKLVIRLIKNVDDYSTWQTESAIQDLRPFFDSLYYR